MKNMQTPIAPQEPAASAQRLTAIHIRWMIRRDRPEVMAIEEQCFLNEWTLPWQEKDFIRTLRQRNVIGMVVDGLETPFKDRVLGYMIYELHRDHLYLLNFAVAEQVQCRGIGTAMVGKLRSKIWVQGRSRIVVPVAEQNLAGQKFFARMGFRATGVDHHVYDSVSAYMFEYHARQEAPDAVHR